MKLIKKSYLKFKIWRITRKRDKAVNQLREALYLSGLVSRSELIKEALRTKDEG